MIFVAWHRWAAGLLVVAPLACRAPEERPPTLDGIAEGYVRLALELAQHKPDLVEAWNGPDGWRPGPRRPVADIRADLSALRTSLGETDRRRPDVTERPRIAYLRGQMNALDLAARRLLGESMTLADETRAAFGVAPLTPDESTLDTARTALEAELPGAGAPRDRLRAFRARFVLPAARARGVLEAALAACRQVVRDRIGLPGDEHVELEMQVDSPWDGFARYHGRHRSTIELSGRAPLDISRALYLACHEGYPGHHVQHVLIDDALVRGRRWMEFQLTPAFGPHLLVSEGAADAGAMLAFPPESRTRLYRELLFPLAGLPAVDVPRLVRVEELTRTLDQAIPAILGSYLDSATSREDTILALERNAAVLDPDALVAFAERRRTIVVAYPLGRRLVEAHLQRGGADPWGRLVAMFTESPFMLE
jgi:hypothetical protein